jgi:predicted metal-binding protein
VDRARAAGLSLAVSDPAADVPADAARLAAVGLDRGASRAVVVPASTVALDPEAPANAHHDPCSCPGLNLMSPPLAPRPTEFAGWLGSFGTAILTEVTAPFPVDDPWRQGGPGWRCAWTLLRSDPARWSAMQPAWRRLHEVTMWLERECMRCGYYLAVGFGAGDCELCDVCDTSELCVEPYAARPSLEALGVDVVRTREAAGWTGGAQSGEIALTGIVLLV